MAIRLFEMFAGYGGASFALKKAGIPFECVGYSEIDKYAIQCYEQNHKGKSFGDANKIDPLDIPSFDLLTGGFPCQAFSVAGKGLGELDSRGTLFWEIIRIARIHRPRYMLLENVKGLTNKKHKPTFDKILSELRNLNYYVKYQILNSKEHGIPQNRERIFFACFQNYDDYCNFNFPEKEELKILLKNILEEEVEDKYYLSDNQREILLNGSVFRQRNMVKEEICQTLQSAMSHGNTIPCIKVIGNLNSETWQKRHECIRRVYSPDGLSPTIPTSQGGGITPKILKTQLGKHQQDCFYGINGIMASIPAGTHGSTPHLCKIILEDYSIRRLTPKECFRLMGFLEDEINLEGLSNTQKYKLAGNGWDINLVSKIFKCMFSTLLETNE